MQYWKIIQFIKKNESIAFIITGTVYKNYRFENERKSTAIVVFWASNVDDS